MASLRVHPRVLNAFGLPERTVALEFDLAVLFTAAEAVGPVQGDRGPARQAVGMHWTTEGAASIIALRCQDASGRWNELWPSAAPAQAGLCATV